MNINVELELDVKCIRFEGTLECKEGLNYAMILTIPGSGHITYQMKRRDGKGRTKFFHSQEAISYYFRLNEVEGTNVWVGEDEE